MSVEAISWAFQQPVPHASAKFVLVAMANHADADMRCWPSSAHLCSQTAQDRKTVQANLQRLRDWGYIVDTGERRGVTKQVPVYMLKQPENGPVKASSKAPESGAKTPEIGGVEQAQNRAASAEETGPNFPPNRPVFPHKQAQISPETGPKTGHGTIRNHQEPSGNPVEASRRASGTRLPTDWKPGPDDVEFCRATRPDLNPQTVADRFRDYWTAAPGAKGRKSDWPATWRNWVRNERQQQTRPAYQSATDKARTWASRITGDNRNDRHDDPEFIDLNPAPARGVG